MPDPAELVRRKAELRTELLARRQALAAEAARRAADDVAKRLPSEFELPPGAVVAGYWPLADELDPRPAMRSLAATGHPLALPRMAGKSAPLAFHAWAFDEPLIQAGFAVMQPDPARPKVMPDVLLVPLLAFDRRCHRLGYGRGYYDRTLRSLRAAGAARLAIGVAFAVQEMPEVPVEAYDEPLDAVVTERGWRRRPPP